MDDGSHHGEQVLRTVRSESAAALSPVAASWCRSALRYGLDPDGMPAVQPIEAAMLARIREASGALPLIAGPVIDTLFGSVARSGACLLLANGDGVVLDMRAGAADHAHFVSHGLAPGADWGEAREGTNGIGTCLVEQRPVTIRRNEHFASRNTAVSCMAAPVFDPEGRVMAALNVSSARSDLDDAMALLVAALVHDAARTIERDVFCQSFADARIVLAPGERPGGGPSLLAVDRDDLVIGATRAARRRLGLEIGTMLDPRPLGDVLGQPATGGFDDGDRAVLRRALARAGGNVSAAARLLGIGRATFYRRMERVGLTA
ncbi:GAF domain-containing protein [Novosphingobium sp. PhB165]|uniref:GAF domain-containing protein n=1 Tax=Novosphingobium sp. PhB165 TaxID=2485105 RepID=UPI001052A23B|nr:GAF domain-containing protein [Novosphingobium sp. PhB165]TCM19834.1 GAF domain-containing protein [Novosphingobium sp. PhB165]